MRIGVMSLVVISRSTGIRIEPRRTSGLLCLVLVAAFSAPTSAAPETQRNATPLSEERAIGSDDWLTRRTAFLSLIGVSREQYDRGSIPNIGEFVRRNLAPLSGAAADRRKRLLIDLLERENLNVNGKEILRVGLGLRELPPADRLDEAYLNYYGDVIAAIAGLADRRSVRVLVDAMTTGEMARGTLISFGPTAVQPVADRIFDASEYVRSSAVFTLVQMLARSKAIADDQTSRQIITAALTSAANDSSYLVRSRIVEGLVQLGDPESISIVRQLAREDPYVYPPEYVDRQGRYPVREAAAAALKSRGIR